jgi:Pro-kumamolisin, activation domain
MSAISPEPSRLNFLVCLWKTPRLFAGALMAVLMLAFVGGMAHSQGNAAAPPQILRNHVPQIVGSQRAQYVGAVSLDQTMELNILLPLRNQVALRELLTRLYDPASPEYHKFLSVEVFTARFGPTESDYQAVVDFAVAKGLTVTGGVRNRLMVPVAGSVA